MIRGVVANRHGGFRSRAEGGETRAWGCAQQRDGGGEGTRDAHFGDGECADAVCGGVEGDGREMVGRWLEMGAEGCGGTCDDDI